VRGGRKPRAALKLRRTNRWIAPEERHVRDRILIRIDQSTYYRALLLSALIASAAPGVFAQDTQENPGASGPSIKLSADSWDFGERWSGQPASTVITVSNIGDAPLEIRKVGRDCACLVAKLDDTVLAPGKSVSVELSYNTKKPKPEAEQKVWFETNDPKTPTATVNVTGRVHKVFNINIAHELMFGLMARKELAERSVEIVSKYDKPIRLKLEPLESDRVAVRMETLEEGKRFKVTATTKPPLPYGQLIATARIRTGLAFLPELPIRISGFVQPAITVEPEKIVIPGFIDRRTLRILRVSSRREKPIKITDISTSDECVAAELLPESSENSGRRVAGQILKVKVSLPPASELPEKGVEITIKTDDPEFKELVVPVRPQKGPHAEKN
jgi:hypothetical protein